jgi:predicted Rossmann fold nucleotide-binding protein DprA/Smf involved in DNA uptake
MITVTSWEEKAAQRTRQEIALNLLREGMTTEAIVRVTGLTTEQVQHLLSQLQNEN